MKQQDIDFIFNLTMVMHEHPWFQEKKRTRDEVQNWVAEKLAEREIYTIPLGMSWGKMVTKERYDDYHKMNDIIDNQTLNENN